MAAIIWANGGGLRHERLGVRTVSSTSKNASSEVLRDVDLLPWVWGYEPNISTGG